jgi:hypothetical protein
MLVALFMLLGVWLISSTLQSAAYRWPIKAAAGGGAVGITRCGAYIAKPLPVPAA